MDLKLTLNKVRWIHSKNPSIIQDMNNLPRIVSNNTKDVTHFKANKIYYQIQQLN